MEDSNTTVTTAMTHKDSQVEDWMEFARQSFENDLARIMAKKEMRRKHLAEKMSVTPPRVTQMLGRRSNYQLRSLVKIALGVGAVLEVRLADEESEVVRVVDIPTASYLDDRQAHLRKLESAPSQDNVVAIDPILYAAAKIDGPFRLTAGTAVSSSEDAGLRAVGDG